MFQFSKLKKQDILLSFLVAILSIFGLVSVFTTTFFPDKEISRSFWQHLIFVGVGIFIYAFLTGIETRWLQERKLLIFLWLLNIGLLFLVLVLNHDYIGPKRWLTIGNIAIQPSEFAKLSIIIVTAYIWQQLRQKITQVSQFSRQSLWQRIRQSKIFQGLLLNTVAISPLLLLVFIQPSLGNTLLLAGIWILMLIVQIRNLELLTFALITFITGLNLTLNLFGQLLNSEAKVLTVLNIGICLLLFLIAYLRRHKLHLPLIGGLLVLGLIAGLFSSFAWNNLLTEYQKDRIDAYVYTSGDNFGSQWQVEQSRIAIGAGQFFGRGMLQGVQTNYGFLPYAHTDFAYAAWSEQFGFVGSFTLLATIAALISRIFMLAYERKEAFEQLIIYGVGFMLLLNSGINIAMNLGLLPVTGIPLPFISYGGSALITNFIGIGLVQMQITEKQPLI